MALKFRRGTTAQKSGSLAFGEPYINTTLGTLQVGLNTGDVTLLINSSSQGISGSSLDITGNAKIDGNLTLGGNITIGDNTSDTVTVTANLSSSLIPSVTNTFDLGSPSKIWRDLYLSTGSIKLVDGGGNIVNTITNANVVTTDSIASGSVTLTNSLPSGVVSGSSQVIDILSSLNTFSSSNGNTSLNAYTASNDTTNALQTTRIDQLAASTASLNSFTASNGNTSLNAYTASNDTTNTTQNTRLTRLEESTASINLTTASLNGHVADINAYTSSNDTTNALQTTRINQLAASTASINLQTASVAGHIVDINTYTSSLKTAFSVSGEDLTVFGNLTVQGDSVTLNVSNLLVEDKVIEIASGSTTSAVANGAGIFISGANASILWDHAASTLDINKSIDVVGNITLTGTVDNVDISIQDTLYTNKFSTLQTYTASVDSTLARLRESTASLNVFSASENTKSETLRLYTASIDTKFSTLQTYTSSVDLNLARLGESTASLNTYTGSFPTATATLTNKTISGASNTLSNIGNASLSNSSITIAGQSTSLGGTITADTIRVAIGTVVTGSAQVIGILSSLNTYTGSNDTTNATQNSRLDQLSTASGSDSGRLSNLESFSTSALTRLSNLEGTDIAITLTGDVTGTGTITNLGNVSFATTIATNSIALGTDTTGDYVASLVAGSGITLSNNSGEGSTPTVALTNTSITIAGQSTALGSTVTADTIRAAIGTVVTGSSQIAFSGVTGTVSNSQLANSSITIAGQSTALGSTVTADTIRAAIGTVVTGSSQINFTALSGISANIISASSDTANVDMIISGGSISANLFGGVVSGSSQINLANVTGNSTSNVSEGSNLYYTDTRVKTKLDAEGVLSGSTINGSKTFSNNVTITGDLTVNGTTTTVNSNTVNIGDNIIVLNSDETGVPSQNAGIEIERGTSTNATLIWDEANDYWKAGLSESEVPLVTTTGTQTLTNKTISGASNTLSNIANASLTNSSITIAGQSTALGSSITAETIRTAIGTVVTGSAQIVGSSITTNTITIGSTSTALGGTSTTLAGLTSVASTGFTGALTGNASTATTLQTARTINGTSFDGSANITIANLVSGSSQIAFSGVTGTVSNSQLANSSISIAGQSTSLGGSITAETIRTAIGTVVTGSSQISHDSTTGFSANRHIDHTAVSITAGTGLSGGGDISTTRTLSIDSTVATLTGTQTLTNKTISGASNTLTNIANASLTNSSISIAGTATSLGGSISAETIRAAIGTVVTGSAQITGIGNAQLTNSSLTVTAGSGLSGGGAVSLGSSITLTNAGVTSNVAGTGISVSGATGAVTISNTGVTSAVAGTGVSVSGATGAVTISIGQSVATSASPTFAGLTINGSITATGDITAFFTSDKRYKDNVEVIPNALDKVKKLNGVTWEWNDLVDDVTKQSPNTGLIAQEVQEVLPQVVKERGDGYLGLDYSKMMGLLVEAIKEQQLQIENLKIELTECRKQNGL
jgi:hypothetical protein